MAAGPSEICSGTTFRSPLIHVFNHLHFLKWGIDHLYFGSTASTRGLQLGECQVTHQLRRPFFNAPSWTKPPLPVRKYAPIQRSLYKDFSLLGYGGNRFVILTFAVNCFHLQGSPNCSNYPEEGWKQDPPKRRNQSTGYHVSEDCNRHQQCCENLKSRRHITVKHCDLTQVLVIARLFYDVVLVLVKFT